MALVSPPVVCVSAWHVSVSVSAWYVSVSASNFSSLSSQ